MMTQWRFQAVSFNQKTPFDLNPEIPFIGDYASACKEVQKRMDLWESCNDDTICRVDLKPVIFPDHLHGRQAPR